MRISTTAALVILLASSLLFPACAAPDQFTAGDDEIHSDTKGPSEPIIGGTNASAFPEAVLVDMSRNGKLVAACSGAMIAPKVVLTAGHCVAGFDGWRVTAPFAGKQVAKS